MSEPKKVGRPLGPINQPRNRAATQNPEFLKAKIALVQQQERKIALANDLAVGKLLPIAEVTRGWASICRDVRGAMLALPARLQARIPSLSRDQIAIVDEEIRGALTALGTADECEDEDLI